MKAKEGRPPGSLQRQVRPLRWETEILLQNIVIGVLLGLFVAAGGFFLWAASRPERPAAPSNPCPPRPEQTPQMP